MLYCTSRKSDGLDFYIKVFQFYNEFGLELIPVTRGNSAESADRKQLDRFEQVIRNFIAQNFLHFSMF